MIVSTYPGPPVHRQRQPEPPPERPQEPEPFLDEWRQQEPPPPGPEVWQATLKGALWGAAAGLAIGGFTSLGYQSMAIPEAAGLQFGTLLVGFGGGGTLLGPKLQPQFDPTTSAAVGGVAGLGFALVTSTLAVATGLAPAIAGGALVGAALGFTGGLIHSDPRSKN